MNRAEQERRYREVMGLDESALTPWDYSDKPDFWTCICGHAVYDHSIRRILSGGGYHIGICSDPACPCGKFRNPNADPDSVDRSVWEFMRKSQERSRHAKASAS